MRLRLLSSLLLLPLAFGCATISSAQGGEVDYAKDAEANLKRGNEALENRNYEEASAFFEYVRTRYPFENAAVSAELRLADVDFARDEYLEARDRYQNFVKLHPSSDRVDYAAFRAALTHYKEIPSDFFLVPSSREKDQAEVQNALRTMNDFVRAYPRSKHLEEAKKLVSDITRRLAEHELYVAEFYAKRGRWKAVVGRLSNVVDRYQGSGYEEQAFFGIHDAYVQLAQPEKAKETLKRIVETLPNSPAAERARRMLGG
ncbi:MAG: outer membrane protein assembly factor BamD [Myxococcaceae bacterium]|nr:outer membrane protein assembly factor BamD [Myxococcaceae bacterium]MCI0671419.1 outer membrane protein assembly factor BamD [Myxococcaceae bacterium]